MAAAGDISRRKIARSIERQSAAKRGGDQTQISLDSVERQVASDDESNASDEADAFLTTLKTELPEDLFVIVEGVLAGNTHRELAASLGIDERTVRRRLSRVRQLLDPNPAKVKRAAHVADSPQALPRVNYNEFVLGKLIGSGGFGKVYRASMQSGGRTVVAVKFVRKAFWQNEGARESFLREINIASQINHPGVIRYLGFGESPHGGPYVISEWIDGRSLQEVSNVAPKQRSRRCGRPNHDHRFWFLTGISRFIATSPGRNIGLCRTGADRPSFRLNRCEDRHLRHWRLDPLAAVPNPTSTGRCYEEAMAETLTGLDPETSDRETVPKMLCEIMNCTLRKSPADRTISVLQIVDLLAKALPATSSSSLHRWQVEMWDRQP